MHIKFATRASVSARTLALAASCEASAVAASPGASRSAAASGDSFALPGSDEPLAVVARPRLISPYRDLTALKVGSTGCAVLVNMHRGRSGGRPCGVTRDFYRSRSRGVTRDGSLCSIQTGVRVLDSISNHAKPVENRSAVSRGLCVSSAGDRRGSRSRGFSHPIRGRHHAADQLEQVAPLLAWISTAGIDLRIGTGHVVRRSEAPFHQGTETGLSGISESMTTGKWARR